eukprot:6212440-Pleurochrysis_carterae.AAC.3
MAYLSNNLSNPYDTKTWFKLIHRNLRLNSNDKAVNTNRCRLCEQARESHAHLLTCSKLNHMRRFVLKLLRATGLDLDSFAYPQTWLTCLNEHNEPLNNVQVALITIHWNVLYKHMTKQKLVNRTFSDRAALKDYARTVAHRILALTKTLVLHNQSRQFGSYDTQTINTSTTNSLHTLGHFNPNSGYFKLNDDIAELLKTYDPLLVFPPLVPQI